MMDLKLSGDGKELIVATFGRSQFKLPLSVDATDGGGVGGSVPATLALTLGTLGELRRLRARRRPRLHRDDDGQRHQHAPATRR